LIPLLLEIQHRDGRPAAARFLAAAGGTAVIVGAGVSLALAATAPWLLPVVAPGLAEETRALALRLLYVLSPAVAASSLSYLWAAALNAEERYALAAVAPTLQPLGAVVGLLVVPGSGGVVGMAVGLTLGAVAQALVLRAAVKRADWSVRFRWPLGVERISEFGRHYGLLFVGSALMGATTIVNQALATKVSAGAVAYFSFASVTILFTLGMGARVVGQLALSQFSLVAASGDFAGLARRARRALHLVWWLSIPAAIVLMAAAGVTTQLLFERGAFSADDSKVVTVVTRALALQIPWYLANIVAVRLLSALQLNRAVLLVATANLGLTLLINSALQKQFGLVGIAVGTAVVYAFSFVACWWLAIRRINASSEANGTRSL
jgi:putative peptidoglycan lipid II flippase